MKQGWELKKLGEVANVSSGNSAPQDKELFKNGIYPFIRTSDAGQIKKGIINSCVDYLNGTGIKGLKLYRKGTILFPKSGASTFLNHRVMMNIDGYVSSHLATIKGNNLIVNDKFLLHYLITVDARDLMQDIAYPSLKVSDIGLIPIPIPPLSEQERIVSILDQAFSAIEQAKANAEKNLKNAKELFDSYLNEIFTNKGEDWEGNILEEVAEENCSLSYGIVQPGEDYPYGLHIVRPTDLTKLYIRLDGLKRIDPKLADGYKRTKLIGDELLLCVRGTTGLVSIATLEIQGGNVTRGIVPIRFNSKLVSQEFGYYLLISNYVQKQIIDKTYGTALMQINIGDLRNVLTTYPSLKKQQTIVRQLDNMRAETKNLEEIYQQKIIELEDLKKSILQKAFNGEL